MVESKEKLKELVDPNKPKPKGFVSADDVLTAHRMTYYSDANVKTSGRSGRTHLPNPDESIKKRNARVFGTMDKPNRIKGKKA